jgi:2-keto-4-pentenoate hydratase/2-oxohepta-3-ene-1,7-dioic acid hydratase in catechol pathway
MKVVCIDIDAQGCATCLTERSDSSVLRNSDDFYMPAFSQDMRCSVGYYLRVTRLAKCVPAKFASRCYDAVGVAVAFTAQDVVERNCALCRPCDEAYCFDKSIALSPEMVAPEAVGEGALNATIGGATTAQKLSDIQLSLDDALARASELLTLKTGDIVYVAATPSLAKVAIGDRVEVSLNEKTLLNFAVK